MKKQYLSFLFGMMACATMIAQTSVTTTSTDVSCHGGSNGSAIANATGGTSPYMYSWAPSGGTDSTATGLSAGTYTVLVIDQTGGSATATAVINEPNVITGTTTPVNASCNGACNGSATVIATGGTSPYGYSWSSSSSTTSTTGLCAGTYTVVINDMNMCTGSATVVITDPAAISIKTSTGDATCGQCNGWAVATVAGGTTAYNYSWTNGGGTGVGTTDTITGLCPGQYSIAITDANGCTAIAGATVNAAANITVAIQSQTDVDCNGNSTGAVTVTVTNGNSPYTYSWNNNATTNSLSNLPMGVYTVTATDNNGCTGTLTVNITEPAVLASQLAAKSVLCFGDCTGSIGCFPAGGTSPYSYSWSTTPNAQTTSNATGLCAGTYTVVIIDANGCSTTNSTTVNQPASALTVTMSTNSNTGTATPSGGTPGYSYSWAPSAGTDSTATGLSNGTYTCTITDANGCTLIDSVTIVGVNIKNQVASKGIRIYPNPAHGELIIEAANVNASDVISINNILGATILNVSSQQSTGTLRKSIDVSNLPKGVYFVVIKNNISNYVERIIIE